MTTALLLLVFYFAGLGTVKLFEIIQQHIILRATVRSVDRAQLEHLKRLHE